MPEIRPGNRAGVRVLLAILALLALAMAVPAVAHGRDTVVATGPEIHDAAVPGDERCADESPDPNTGQKSCDKPLVTAGTILPIIGIVIAGGVLALLLAYLVLRRRASAPLIPVDPGEWWLCPKCGSTNVVGSARCYACGTWQR